MTTNDPASDFGPTTHREILVKWVVAGLVVLLLAAAGIGFASFVGRDSSVPAGTVHWREMPTACDRISAAGRIWLPASDVGPNWQSVTGTPPTGHRVVVRHRWFRRTTYTLIADDGSRVPLSEAMICQGGG
jgi:hypothetical protein